MMTDVGSSRSRQALERGPTPVSSRVSPTECLCAEIDEVCVASGDLASAIEQVARLGAQLLLQAALEAEVTVFLGRDRYARAASTEDARAGSRNGYCPTTVKTTAGPVTLERLKLRGTTERFASQLFRAHRREPTSGDLHHTWDATQRPTGPA